MRHGYAAVAGLTVAILAAFPCPADSLFSGETEERGSLITENKKQFEVGDIVTVLVRETIDASSEADTNTQKESQLEAQTPVASNPFLVNDDALNIVSPGELPNWDIDVENEHRARGGTQRTNRLIMTVACTVTQVHKNGNMDIEGSKKMTINREESMMEISGTVRSKDVTPANTIDSGLVANANVELKGRGPLWNNQRRGILTKILDWFSPF